MTMPGAQKDSLRKPKPIKESPTTIAFEQMYCDGSGVEFSVSYSKRREDGEIELHHVDKVGFPIHMLDWLIARLTQIREELDP